MWYGNTTEYYAVNNNKLLIYATIYMSLKMIIVSKKSQRPSQILHSEWLLLYKILENSKLSIVREENQDPWVPNDGVESGWAGMTKGYKEAWGNFCRWGTC